MARPRVYGRPADLGGDRVLVAAGVPPLPVYATEWAELVMLLAGAGAAFPEAYLNVEPGAAWDAGACGSVAEAARRLAALAREGFDFIRTTPAPHLRQPIVYLERRQDEPEPYFGPAKLSLWDIRPYSQPELQERLLGLGDWFADAAKAGGAGLEVPRPQQAPERPLRIYPDAAA